jgi:hypothetical protein
MEETKVGGKFIIGKRIGGGAFGEVYAGMQGGNVDCGRDQV